MKQLKEGVLKKVNDQFLIYYREETDSEYSRIRELPLYPEDAKLLTNPDSKMWEKELKVNFEIIDEFTHQKLYEGFAWGEGKFAKINLQ
jgi:hypothetical protein